MTLLYLDGFDVGDFALKWGHFPHGSNAADISTTVPFGAGRSLKIPADTASVFGETFTYLKRGLTPSATVIVGFNFRWNGTPSIGMNLLTLFGDAGATSHLQLVLGDDGTLALYRADGTLLGTGAVSGIIEGAWYFLEIKASINDSTGTAIGHVNEATVINFTGDTRNGGTSTNIDSIALGKTDSGTSGTLTPDLYFDDLYVCNSAGGVNDDFLGIGRVQTLLPSAAGADTELTPTGSPDNWENVNDVPWSAADFNSSEAAGDRDLYQLDDLNSATSDVKAIQTVVIADSTDAAAHIKAALKSGGTVYYDSVVALNGTPTAVSVAVREDDPATSAAWTPAGVNALQAGAEVAS